MPILINTDRATRIHSIKLRLIEMIAQQTTGIDRDTLLYKYKISESCHADLLDHDLLWYLCNTLVTKKYVIKDGDKYFWTGREF